MMRFSYTQKIENYLKQAELNLLLENLYLSQLRKKIVLSEERLNKLRHWDKDKWLEEKKKVLEPYINHVNDLLKRNEEIISEVDKVLSDEKNKVESLYNEENIDESMMNIKLFLNKALLHGK